MKIRGKMQLLNSIIIDIKYGKMCGIKAVYMLLYPKCFVVR